MDAGRIKRKQLSLDIQYLLAERDTAGKIISSGVLVPTSHIENELQIDISNDPIFDEDTDEFVDSEKYQVNLRGTQKAFQELGTLLIALAHYEEDPDYHIHIDNIEDSEGQVAVHLIIHVPVDVGSCMGKFAFLKSYIAQLPEAERNDPYCGYVLKESKDAAGINRLESKAEIPLPEELKEFYEFSYGALLSEYKMLTISEIANLLGEMRCLYEDDWRSSILPFAYVRGVGDVVAFDLNESDENGLLLVLDGFHESPPTQWKGI
jgi:hypothetical protein